MTFQIHTCRKVTSTEVSLIDMNTHHQRLKQTKKTKLELPMLHPKHQRETAGQGCSAADCGGPGHKRFVTLTAASACGYETCVDRCSSSAVAEICIAAFIRYRSNVPNDK